MSELKKHKNDSLIKTCEQIWKSGRTVVNYSVDELYFDGPSMFHIIIKTILIGFI